MKIKNVIFFLFLFLLVHISFAQSLFDKKYLQGLNEAQLLQVDNVGNIYIAGEDHNSKIDVIKFDTSGNVIWGKIFGYDSLCQATFDMLITQDQKIIITGVITDCIGNWNDGVIICLDTAGSLIYTKVLGNHINETYYRSNIIPDSMGYTMSVDYQAPTFGGLKLIKFDKTGTIIYENTIDYANSNVLRRPDGSYILYFTWGGNGFSFLYTDSNFMNVQNSFSEYASSFSDNLVYKMIYVNDSTYYVIGSANNQPCIGHVDGNLKCDWVKIFTLGTIGCGNGQNFFDFQHFTNGDWMFVGNVDDLCSQVIYKTDYFILHTDSNFNPLNIKYIASMSRGSIAPVLYKTALVKDNFLFEIMHVDSAHNSSLATSFELVKEDTSLSGICNSSNFSCSSSIFTIDTVIMEPPITTSSHPTIINSINLPVKNFVPLYGLCSDPHLSTSEIDYYKKDIAISPNPSTGIFYIHSNISEPIEKVEAFNYLGERVFFEVGKIQEMNLIGQTKGIYFYNVCTSNGSSFRGKLVKE